MPWWLRWHLTMSMSLSHFNGHLDTWLPRAVWACALGLVAVCVQHIDASSRRTGASLLRRVVGTCHAIGTSVAAVLVFCCAATTLLQLRPELRSGFPPSMALVYDRVVRAQHLPVASPYGLFRSMTGMGQGATDQWCVVGGAPVTLPPLPVCV